MKKFTSIFLILLLVLNTLGFYGLILAIDYHHNRAFVKSMDADNYDERELIQIEVPHSIPYAVEQPNFQRIDGQFQHEGEYYRLVKQRITFDSVYLVVVKDKMSKKTNKALKEYTKSLTDQPSSEKPSGKGGLNFYNDYFGSSFAIATISFGWEQDVFINGCATKNLFPFYTHTFFTPPELA